MGVGCLFVWRWCFCFVRFLVLLFTGLVRLMVRDLLVRLFDVAVGVAGFVDFGGCAV